MKTILVLALVVLSGCAGRKLMRCEGQVGAEYWSCPTRVQGQYFLCSQPKDILRCEDVR